MSPLTFQPEPFQPPLAFRNPHVQTVVGAYTRNQQGIHFRRQRIETPDDDFIDLDFAEVDGHSWAELGASAPILFFIHGLEGDARRGYATDLYKVAAKLGFRPVGMNHRSCSGEMNRQARFYHMGASDDVDFIFRWLEKTYPHVPKVLVGVSLGGNMLLKYLGEQGTALAGRVVAGAAISPPLVATGKQAINYGVGAFYGYYLLRSLQSKVRLKAALLRTGNFDVERALKARILRDFDEVITAPVHGFKDAEDYYARCNSINFLSGIRVPTLILRSLDDPFFNQDIPHDMIAANPALQGLFPAYGGHVGFIHGFQKTDWAQTQVMKFFQSCV